MASLAGVSCRRPNSWILLRQNCGKITSNNFILYSGGRAQRFNAGADPAQFDFLAENAYDILGVSETSSFEEIKASFRKLAKETHPDLADSNDSAASHRFVQILAAYEILSDSEKRAHYDYFLVSQRRLLKKYGGEASKLYVYKSNRTTFKQMEVVEWLKFYRFAINDILSEKKVAIGTGYFDVLERDFYSAIHAAFYGPDIESTELFPDRFEAEERSTYETPEVLHLVSGRDLLGMVCLVADKTPRLASANNEKLTSSSSASTYYDICQPFKNISVHINMVREEDLGIFQMSGNVTDHEADAYKDLELHVSGRVVAVANRVPPKIHSEGIQNEDTQDRIQVFLRSPDNSMHIIDGSFGDLLSMTPVEPMIPLGTITGLGTSPDEGSCFVYDSSGTKTHVLMKHRTLMVKHMHWYSIGDEVSVCECRCSRARLPPSKYWLFEPRCGMHDIGGWYVETFGRDKKGRTVPSQRYWDSLDAYGESDKRLHPAMYLFGLAYRTLDIEEAKKRKHVIRDVIKGQLYRILNWSKKLA